MFDYVDLDSDDGTLEHWNCGGRTRTTEVMRTAWLKSFDQQPSACP